MTRNLTMSILAMTLDAAKVPQPRAGEGLEEALIHSWPWPPWMTLLLFIVAAVFFVFLYLREPGPTGRATRLCLAMMRLSLFTIVLTMMYGWMRDRFRTDLPDLVVVLDDSQSMGLVDQYGDATLARQLRELLQSAQLAGDTRLDLAKSLLLPSGADWLGRLRERYNLKFYLLGSTARIQSGSGDQLDDRVRRAEADQPASRLGDGLQGILEAQRGRPTAALVLLSDGVTTEGKSIAEIAHYARRKGVPLYLVGVGDQRPPRDLRLSDLLVDEVVFLGDMVSFDFKLAGTGFAAEQVAVSLVREGSDQVLARQQLELPGDGQTRNVRLSYRPDEVGTFSFAVRVEPLQNESNLSNNELSQTVQVRDEAIRVLYVQEYPSLEFRFLKTLLERGLQLGGAGKAIQLTTVLQEADPGYVELDETAQRVFPVGRDELFVYDVVIFGDVNPAFMSRPILENLAAFVKERGGGVIFLAGPRHTPLAYRDSPLEDLFPLDLNTAQLPDEASLTEVSYGVQLTRLGLVSPPLQLIDESEANAVLWKNLPHLRWLLRAPDMRLAARILVETSGDTSTPPLPVVSLQLVGAGRVVFHATDESYLWARVHGSDEYYERYWLQMIRYLSRAKLLGANRSVELVPDRNQYYRGETIPLQVRFFDDRMAPAADDGVVVLLEREEGRRQRVKLQRDLVRRGVFEATVGNLAEGAYRAWIVVPTMEGQPPSWQFAVVPPPGEHAKLEMDAEDLQQAAKTSEGRFFTLRNARSLLNELPHGRQVRIESLPPTPVWNSPLLVALFVALLTGEWLWRKRLGWL